MNPGLVHDEGWWTLVVLATLQPLVHMVGAQHAVAVFETALWRRDAAWEVATRTLSLLACSVVIPLLLTVPVLRLLAAHNDTCVCTPISAALIAISIAAAMWAAFGVFLVIEVWRPEYLGGSDRALVGPRSTPRRHSVHALGSIAFGTMAGASSALSAVAYQHALNLSQSVQQALGLVPLMLAAGVLLAMYGWVAVCWRLHGVLWGILTGHRAHLLQLLRHCDQYDASMLSTTALTVLAMLAVLCVLLLGVTSLSTRGQHNTSLRRTKLTLTIA